MSHEADVVFGQVKVGACSSTVVSGTDVSSMKPDQAQRRVLAHEDREESAPAIVRPTAVSPSSGLIAVRVWAHEDPTP